MMMRVRSRATNERADHHDNCDDGVDEEKEEVETIARGGKGGERRVRGWGVTSEDYCDSGGHRIGSRIA